VRTDLQTLRPPLTMISTIVAAIIVTRSSLDGLFAALPLPGTDLSAGALLNFAVIALAVLNMLMAGWRVPRVVLTAWGPFILIYSIAALYSPDRVAAFRDALVVLSYACIFYLGYVSRFSSRFVWLLLLLASIVPLLSSGIAFLEDPGTRLQGVFGHPNILAFFVVVVSSYLVSVLVSPDAATRQERRAIAVVLLGLAACLILTGTRSAWAGYAVVGLCFVALWRPRYLLFAAVLPFVFLEVPGVWDRVAEIFRPVDYDLSYVVALADGNIRGDGTDILNSYVWRQFLWQEAWGWIVASPLFGHGAASFVYYSNDFFPLAHDTAPGAHNDYVRLLFEAGIFGFAAYVWLLVVVATRAVLGLRVNRPLAASIVALLLAYAVVSYSDNMLNYLTVNWYLWFAAGAGLAYLQRRVVHQESDDPALPAVAGTSR
jgi:putative inorganic carbon (hco3(-)) transporter